jgi:hypothetical protein
MIAKIRKPEMSPPIDPSTLPPAVLTKAANDMKRVLAQAPELGDFGFGVFDDRKKTVEQRQAELMQERDDIQHPSALAAFAATRIWLSQFRKIKTLNKPGTSYGLKHAAECDVGYITNGVFIAAAIAEGFRVSRVGFTPNAYLNISKAAWGRGWRRGDQETFFDKPYAQRLAEARSHDDT